MIYLLKYFEKETRQLIIMGLLLTWALSSSIYALKKENQTLLLQMNGFDTRVIDQSEQPPIEIENFFHNFVGLFYSYNSQNYESHMNRAAPMLKLSVLKEFAPRLNKMFDRVIQTPVNQIAFIEKINKIQDFDYELVIKVERSEKGQETSNDYNIRLSVDRTDRTRENPYGIEIVKLEEIYD